MSNDEIETAAKEFVVVNGIVRPIIKSKASALSPSAPPVETEADIDETPALTHAPPTAAVATPAKRRGRPPGAGNKVGTTATTSAKLGKPAGKGKRGRPPGSKNKSASAFPGPLAPALPDSAEITPPVKRRGRKPGVAKIARTNDPAITLRRELAVLEAEKRAEIVRAEAGLEPINQKKKEAVKLERIFGLLAALSEWALVKVQDHLAERLDPQAKQT